MRRALDRDQQLMNPLVERSWCPGVRGGFAGEDLEIRLTTYYNDLHEAHIEEVVAGRKSQFQGKEVV